MEEAPANYVPAAAVIRKGQALSGIIGCKGYAGGLISQTVKSTGSTGELPLKLLDLRIREESGIPSVVVKYVDIRKNTYGESSFLF